MPLSLAVLRDGNARRLFLGQLISQTCDKMMSVGLVWMFTEHYPVAVIPAFLGVSALPHLLLAWRAGRWTSRFGHVRTLVSTDAFRGLVYLLLAALWSGLGTGQVDALFVASFVANLASAVFNPAIMSAPVAFVDIEQVQQVTALIESCFSMGSVVGPLLTALLYPWLGLAGLFLVNGLSYLWAAVLETRIRTLSEPEAEAPPAHPWQVLRSDTVVAVMLAGFLASNLFLAPIMVIMPLFVKACYHAHLGSLAGLETAFGLGTIVGGVLLAAAQTSARMGQSIVVGMLGVAAAYLAFSLTTSPLGGDLSLVALGFCLSTTNVFSMTVFQKRLAPADVPTLMSLVNLISVASLPLSMLIVGGVVSNFDIRSIALTCAAGLAVATLAVVVRRDVRAL